MYLNTVPAAFMRWKLFTKYNQDKYNLIKHQTQMISKVVQRYFDLRKRQAHKYFQKWKFQVKYKFPFYHQNKKMKEGLILQKIVERENNKNFGNMPQVIVPYDSEYDSQTGFLIQKLGPDANYEQKNRRKITPFKQKGKKKERPVNIIDILGKLNNAREIISSAFQNQKRYFFTRLRTFYTMEYSILNSKQALLLRTLRLNEENLFKHHRAHKRGDLVNPREFIRMLNGKNEHQEKRYSPHNRAYFVHNYFRDYMNKLRMLRRVQKSSPALLLTGVWGTKEPYLRFRELYMCRILEKGYHKKVYLIYSRLRSHKRVLEYRDFEEKSQEEKKLAFKRVWARIWVQALFNDQCSRLGLMTLYKLEVNKRLRQLIEQRNLIEHKKKMRGINFESTVLDKKDLERILEETFSMRINEVKETFPKKFVWMLLRSQGTVEETQQNLINLLFDLVFYIVCDVVRQTQVYKRALETGRRMKMTRSQIMEE